MSYGYLDRKGLVVGDNYASTRNNVRMRLATEVFDRIKMDGNIGYIDFYRKDPGSSGTSGVFRLAQRISPLLPVKWQQPTADGLWEDTSYWSFGSVANPVRTAMESGYVNRKSKTFNGIPHSRVIMPTGRRIPTTKPSATALSATRYKNRRLARNQSAEIITILYFKKKTFRKIW
ncbi:MAG: hypothetical protein LBD53_09510 [Tannerella sp.]|jgi:hypothetical protein|nr:hypothetical protein [Tannerella sp.]